MRESQISAYAPPEAEYHQQEQELLEYEQREERELVALLSIHRENGREVSRETAYGRLPWRLGRDEEGESALCCQIRENTWVVVTCLYEGGEPTDDAPALLELHVDGEYCGLSIEVDRFDRLEAQRWGLEVLS